MDSAQTAWTPDLISWARAQALTQGFDLTGVAAAPAASDPTGVQTATRFADWLDLGRAGEMDYLKRRAPSGELLRASARAALPWARSVLVCAFNYNAAAPKSIDPANAGEAWIARYAWNGKPDGTPTDYHEDLLTRLQILEAVLQLKAPCQTKSYVDTGPLLERDFATRAGIGWTGKNTVTLNQQLGSWLLLGVIVTSLPVEALTLPAQDRCGTCTRCIDACPTDALVAPRQMDASLCIAYLTIEKKGSIAEDLRAQMGRQVFGCDICQDVCPWNRQAPIAARPGLRPRPELINPALDWLAQLTPPSFKRQFKGSPLERTRLPRLQRNVAIAMGNSADPAFIPQLTTWSHAEDPILAEAATWSLARLDSISIRSTPDVDVCQSRDPADETK